MKPIDHSTLRDYLLGRLPEREVEALEAGYFENHGVLEEIEAVETRLIDEYVYGELPSSDLAAYRDNFAATPRRIESAKISAALRRACDNGALPAATHRRLPAFTVYTLLLFRFAACLLIIAGGWVTWRSYHFIERFHSDVSRMERLLSDVLSESSRRTAVASSQPPTAQRPGVPMVVATLMPGVTRGNQPGNSLRVPPGDVMVRFEFRPRAAAGDLADRISLLTVEGEEIWRQVGSINGKAPAVTIAGTALIPGDYVFALSSGERRIESYPVHLER